MKFPVNIFEQHIAVLGKTGSGKSSVLRLMVERLLDDKQPVCIIDPKGDWWGLKSSASGKRRGYPVVIFGGERGDVPLNEHSGKAVSELIATGNRPAIIDLGGWRVGERTRFWIDFASTLFRHARGHRYFVIDEVHNFAPQGKVLNPDSGEMLHWANRLASEGRGKGLTILSASQRPQKVHKDFLTCAETLVAMRVIHPLDRAAIKDWIDGCDDPAKGKEVVSGLAGLKRGTGWLWSPEIGFGPKLISFPLFKSFDSFAPKANATATRLKGWASVDLKEVSEKLSAVVEEAKANDPRELKKQIAELKRQTGKQSATSSATFTEEYLDGIRSKVVAERDRHWQREIAKLTKGHDSFVAKLRKINQLSAVNGELVEVAEPPAPQVTAARPQRAPAMPPKRHREVPAGDVRISGGALRMVQVLADRHPAQFTEAQWATMSRLKRKGGTWSTYKSRLVQAGLVENSGGLWRATDEAVAQFGDPSRAPQTPDELLADWKQKLGSGPARMLDALWQQAMTRDQLGEAVGLTAGAGTFGTYLSRLRSNGLVIEDGGKLRLAEMFEM